MNTVLVQETIRYNRLVVTITKSLRDVLRALKGQVVMSLQLEQVADALYNNLVPKLWTDVAYPSLMPLAAWCTNLMKRLNFIDSWITNGMPNVFWISGFVFPQAFLTASLQNFARQAKTPVDTVSFNFNVLQKKVDSIDSRPSVGIFVHGLHLQGARFDSALVSLVESRPKELFTAMPPIWFLPEQERKEPNGAITYQCPVYKTLTRQGQLSTTGHSTNFVLLVELKTKASPASWTKASVALFCALDYAT
jgi:dynein heavy chain